MLPKVLLFCLEKDRLDIWLVFLQKLGFSVEAVYSELTLPGRMLAFGPQYVLFMPLNPLEAISMLRKIREQHWYRGKVILLEQPAIPLDLTTLTTLKFDGVISAECEDYSERANDLALQLQVSVEFLQKRLKFLYQRRELIPSREAFWSKKRESLIKNRFNPKEAPALSVKSLKKLAEGLKRSPQWDWEREASGLLRKLFLQSLIQVSPSESEKFNSKKKIDS